MAKRSFSPVLWFLLVVVLRADLTAFGQTRYSAVENASAMNRQSVQAHATLNKATISSTAKRGGAPVNRGPVDYAISGEPYLADQPLDGPGLKQRARRGPSTQDAAAFEYEDHVYEADPQAASEIEQVSYRQPFARAQAVDPYGPEAEYSEEIYEDEYWDAADPAAESSGMGHWLGSLKPEHGHWFRHSSNSPRHIGLGQPLEGTSWRNRPSSVSFFAGVLNGDELIANRVDQGSALFGGFRLGWDFDHYWGVEARAGWSSPDIQYDPAPPPNRVDGIFLCDTSFLYYPWGDSACRPYALLGMGMARFDFRDEFGVVHDEYLLGIPVGFGFKYQYHPNLVFRGEFLDNIACGSSGLNNMNNLSFSMGMELRFGGKPRSYYPWQPAKFIW